MNGAEFIRNCNAFDPEKLAQFENQHVAWSEDGRQILAHAATLEDLNREVQRLGISNYVFDFIPSADQISIGAGI